MRRIWRLTEKALGGAFLGWFVPSLVLFGLIYVAELLSGRTGGFYAIGFMIIAESLPTVLISTATLGVLWHVYAQRKHLTAKSDYWLPGIMVGGVVAVGVPLVTLRGFGPAWMPWFALGTVYGAACGGLTGLYFWLFRRPDRDKRQTSQ